MKGLSWFRIRCHLIFNRLTQMFLFRCAPKPGISFAGSAPALRLSSASRARATRYLIAGLLTAALAQGSGQSPLDNARHALETGHTSEAEAELKDILQSDPNSITANLMLAGVKLGRGDIGQAVVLYRCVLKIDPKSFGAHYGLGMTYLRARQVDAGIAELRRAATLSPSQPDTAYNVGVALLDAGQPRKALAYLQHAKALGSNGPDLAFNLIRAEVAAGLMNTAVREAQENAVIFKKDATWNASVGHLFANAGDPTEAIAYLSSALHLDPGNPDLRHELAAAYIAIRHPELALELIGNRISAEDHYLRGNAYFLQQHMAEAEQESSHCLNLEPEQPRCLLLSARIAQSLGEQESALKFLTETSQRVPNWPDAYYSAAVSYYFERRYTEARQSLDRALKLDPRSARSLFLYGVTLVNEGRNREAQHYLRRAISKEPNNARFRFHLGAALLRDNQPVEAQKEFEKSIQLRPNFALSHYQLGKLIVDRAPVTARLELEDAVRCDPSLAQAYYQLGRVYVKLGQKDKAERALASFNSLKKLQSETPQQDDITSEMQTELRP